MKKLLSLIFLLVCVSALVGCGETAPELEAPPSESSEPIELSKTGTENAPLPPDPCTLTEPPPLSVSTWNAVDRVTAQRYSYSWQTKLEGDQMSHVIACGAHPLDNFGGQGYATLYTAFPAGSLPPLEEGQLPGATLPTFYLDFGEIPPETVTARRWPTSYIGRANELSDEDYSGEEVAVDTSDGIVLLPMGDGEFIYEVHAGWGEAGGADYVFRTLPQVREEQ